MNSKHLFTSDEKLSWWGYGEWVEEPDEVTFEHMGFACRVIRVAQQEPYIKEVCVFGGHLCGYVNIPVNHPMFSKKYDEIDVDVHGGLTWSEMEKGGYWIGFDCAHSGDYCPSLENNRKIFKSPF